MQVHRGKDKEERHETGQRETKRPKRDSTLRRMLLGPALNSDDRPCLDRVDELLTRHLDGLPDVLEETFGASNEATQEAVQDLRKLADLPPSHDGVCCKRAALLFALRREPEVQEHFRRRDPELANDLIDRVLPFIDPEFMRHSCQSPSSYVTLAIVLSQMFKGEKLGNWPLRTTTAPLGC